MGRGQSIPVAGYKSIGEYIRISYLQGKTKKEMITTLKEELNLSQYQAITDVCVVLYRMKKRQLDLRSTY